MDYSQRYERMARPFRSAGATTAINVLDKALVYGFAAAYVILLVVLAVQGDARLVKAFLVPAATFVLASALRIAINRPRPYETHALDPIITKNTVGKSMPSRHMASAVIIAATFLWIWPTWGAVLVVGCACIAFTRIIGGVHYPSDIAVACALSIACAIVGFVLIP